MRISRLSELIELVNKKEVTLRKKEQLQLSFSSTRTKREYCESTGLANFGSKGHVEMKTSVVRQ